MKKANFADVLDAAGELTLDAREELVELLHKRAIEERRAELAREIRNAQADYKHGKCRPSSARAIMKEILS